MYIDYFKEYKLLAETKDYVPSVGQKIEIKDVSYEIIDVKMSIVESETCFEVTVMEKD